LLGDALAMMRMKTRLLLRLNRWSTAAEAGAAGLRPRLRQTLDTLTGVAQALRDRWPELRQRAIAALHRVRDGVRPGEIRRRAEAARVWAAEHDTVPAETVAHARERWLDRQHRHEVHEVERQHRREEHAKFREKKDEEERQTYSVYFE